MAAKTAARIVDSMANVAYLRVTRLLSSSWFETIPSELLMGGDLSLYFYVDEVLLYFTTSKGILRGTG